jgi:hypothetical protein
LEHLDELPHAGPPHRQARPPDRGFRIHLDVGKTLPLADFRAWLAEFYKQLCGFGTGDGRRQVFDAFGPKRIFWGSDISRVRHPYRQMITLFTEELAWLGEEDKTWIMGRGLCEWLGWPVGAAQ